LKCNGAEVDKTTYANLYSVIGDTFAGDLTPGCGKPWQLQYAFNKAQTADVLGWSIGTSLPSVLCHTTAIVTKNRVYVLGGYNGSAYTSTVYTAPINSDGTIGTWVTGTPLPLGLIASSGFVINNKIYLVGGATGIGTYLSNVYYATINSDGTIGSWVTGPSLPGLLGYTKVIVTKKRVYTLAGNNGSIAISTIYTATINDDGTLNAWSAYGSLPYSGYLCYTAVIKDRLYVIGGYSSGYRRDVYYANIDSEGLLGAWISGIFLPKGMSHGECFTTENKIHITFENEVYTAPIYSDGSLGTWYKSATLPYNMGETECVITSSKIYLISAAAGTYNGYVIYADFAGGGNDYSAYYGGADATINYLIPGCGKPWQQQYQINNTQSADITGWSTSGTLPDSVLAPQAIVTKNRVYLIGGDNTTTAAGAISSVYTAPINSDGTLGTWSAGTSLPGALSRSTNVITKNRIYIIGGWNGTSAVSSIYTAVINADGTLGAWSTTTSFPIAIYWTNCVAIKNKLYTFGGINGSSVSVSSIYSATINSDGTIGAWSNVSSLPVAVNSTSIALTKNKIYLIGGHTGSTYLNNVYVASINSDGTLGAWSSSYSLPTVVSTSQVFVTKNTIYLLGGSANSSTPTTIVYKTSISSDGSIGAWAASTSLSSALSGSQVIGTNNRVYLLGGSLNTWSNPTNTIISAPISGGLNDYSSYYDGTYSLDGVGINYMMPGSGKPWQQQYQINETQSADITGWVTETPLSFNICAQGCIVTKNRVYFIGGWNGSINSAISTVYTAPINSDGTLGAWTTGTSLPGAISFTQTITTKNRVYVLGGSTTVAHVSTVYTAPINSDGTLGTWSTGNSLPGNLSSSSAVITKNRIYLIGGHNGSASVSTVYTTVINSDGTIGTWTTGTSLPSPVGNSVTIVTKNRVYLLGGSNSGTYISTVYTAPINTDGTLGAWTTGTSLPIAPHSHNVFVTKNTVYLFGGFNGVALLSSVYRASINADGTLGSWSIATSLPSYSNNASVIATKNRIYLMGNWNANQTTSGTVYSAAILEGLNDYSPYYDGTYITPDTTVNYMMPGSGKPWQQQYQINQTQIENNLAWSAGTALPSVLSSTQTVVTKNRVYLIGGTTNGSNAVSTVYTAPINVDGTLGTWVTDTSIPGVLSNSQAIVTKNRVYLLGGTTTSSAYTSVVYTAPINSDGTLGSWSTATSLPSNFAYSQAIVTKNRVYLLGGHNGSAHTSTVYTAPINTDGTLGTWTTSSSLPGVLTFSSVAITKNRVYLLGGFNGSGWSSTVYTAAINSDGTLGTWSTSTSLLNVLGRSISFVTKDRIWLFGGDINQPTFSANVYTAPINTDGTIGTWVSNLTLVGGALPGGLSFSQLVCVKNYLYLLGGYTGSSTVTSVVYKAPVLSDIQDYSPYYDGTIQPVSTVSTKFKLPDYTLLDREFGESVTSYIKF
jgi:hypothetical protein